MKTPLYRLAPVLFLTIWMAGCAGTVGSPNATTPTGTGSGGGSGSSTQATLKVTPATMSFGNVAVGSSKSLTATLSATNGDVQISAADWSGQGYSLSGVSFPFTVSSGQSAPVTVIFAPTTAGSTPGSVTYASNASNSSLEESFTGTGTSGSTGNTQHNVTLSWSPSSSPVAGYNVYRGTVSGGPYTKINPSLETATVYTDSTVQGATTYYYVATSVDSSSDESSYSNQTVAQVP